MGSEQMARVVPGGSGPAEEAGPPRTADERAADLTMEALDGQLDYFEGKSKQAKRCYQWLRVATVVVAAAIPVVAAAGGDPVISAVLGALIVVFEGIQQVFQCHERWVDFRSNINALESEKRLFLTRAGPYAEMGAPGRTFSERFEAIMNADSVTWRATAGPKGDGGS
jgi:hypothetical protein